MWVFGEGRGISILGEGYCLLLHRQGMIGVGLGIHLEYQSVIFVCCYLKMGSSEFCQKFQCRLLGEGLIF